MDEILRGPEGRKTIIKDDLPYFAGTLPYKTVAQTDAFAALPARLQHTVVAKLYNSSLDRALDSPALTYSMPLSKLGVSTLSVWTS